MADDEQERAPIIFRSDLKREQDLSDPSVVDVMREFGRRIWAKGYVSAIDQARLELRARGMEEAADVVHELRAR